MVSGVIAVIGYCREGAVTLWLHIIPVYINLGKKAYNNGNSGAFIRKKSYKNYTHTYT